MTHYLTEGEFKPYIVKFSTLTDAEDNPRVEFAYSLMARAAGIDMTETHLFDAGKYGACFGSQRFDRSLNQRIHMHSLSGLLHADFRVPNLDYMDFLKVIWLLTKNHDDLCEGFRRMVFNIATHNRDDHSKNFAFLLTKNGWRLSPAYDLTYSAGIAGEHTMTIAGEGANPAKSHILQVAKKLNLAEKNAIEIVQQVCDALSDWEIHATVASVSKPDRDKLARIFRNLCTAISTDS